jgi:L-ascorbate metabolism protein UlaG (beta-lactamase superfamily)
MSAQRGHWPDWVEIDPVLTPARPAEGCSVTWVNHATFLIRTPEASVLTDPHWSVHAGPFGRIGPRRVHAPGIAFDDLPLIDAVLLSHDHYDHCDLPTLRRIARRFPDAILIAPTGHAALAERAGFGNGRFVELGWWDESRRIRGLKITATPARHWSNRLSGKRNGRLWSGFFIEREGQPEGRGGSVYYSGDTAYDPKMFGAASHRSLRAALVYARAALRSCGGCAHSRRAGCDP